MSLSQPDQYLSIKRGQVHGVDLPKFSVITGENGAGKTQLLAAIADGTISLDEVAIKNRDAIHNDIRLVEAGSLTVGNHERIRPDSYRDTWSVAWHDIAHRRDSDVRSGNDFAAEGPSSSQDPDAERLVRNGTMSPEAIQRMKEATGGKLLSDMTRDEFFVYGPLLVDKRNLLEHNLSEIFVTWAMRWRTNRSRRLDWEDDGETVWLTNEDFIDQIGGPPWETVNTVLSDLSLPYQYVKPDIQDESTLYEAVLRHHEGHEVRPGSLSAGERTLLAIAQSLYSTSALLENTRLPKMMLFDEPDQTLHPSMVQQMLNVFEKTFVDKLDIRVVITTHSPSTVALAPDKSLMVMSKTTPRLRAVRKDEALKALTAGIPTLAVRVENQRQVFVEAPIDQEIYQLLFRILQRRHLDTGLTPVFINAATKRAGGGGSTRVRKLVKELRVRGGVVTVFGIVDRDKNNGPRGEGIKFADDRYALENLIADPLLVGCFMLRKDIGAAEELNLPTWTRVRDLKSSEAQTIINAVTKKVGLSGGAARPVTYAEGLTATIPGDYLDEKGHKLVEKLVVSYDRLGAYRPSANRDQLLKDIVRQTAVEYPEFIPDSAVKLLKSVLQP